MERIELSLLTSLLQREVTILARDFGHASRACWEISRALLQYRQSCGMMALNEEEVAGKRDPSQADLPAQPSLDFGTGNERDYD